MKSTNEVVLERVEVKRLFGRFDYDIKFDARLRTSIIIAPNGCGKTTIFRLIDFVFNPTLSKYEAIVNIPFEQFACYLSNRKSVVLRRVQSQHFRYVKPNMPTVPYHKLAPDFVSADISVEDAKYSLELIIDGKSPMPIDLDSIRALSGMGSKARLAAPRGDFESRYPLRFLRSSSIWMRASELCEQIVERLKKAKCSINVAFIDANRLKPTKAVDDGSWARHQGEDNEQERDPIAVISADAKKIYTEILAKYNDLQQQMKNQLPRMYLKGTNCVEGFDAFKLRWEAYIKSVEKYCEIGLLRENDDVIESRELKKAHSEKGEFLQVYLDAFEKTLPPLEEYYGHIKLFLDILNKRNEVTHKKMKFSNKGLLMTMNDKPIPLSCLSSGEKNDLVMFYNLIFNSMKGGVVLVDEPEISLHIAWQEEYLDCLMKICELNNIQAIVATHSPSIVNGHAELYANMEMKHECC